MENPCCSCIVTSMCQKSCVSFRRYLYSYSHIFEHAHRIVKLFPTTYIEIADHMKRDFETGYVWYAPIFDLKETVTKEGTI